VLGSILKDASLRWTDFKAAEIEIGHLRQIDPSLATNGAA
jgi:hypothetical protein